MDLGYIRVSSADQNTDRQFNELGLPASSLYIDHCSGKDSERQELKNLLKAARAGDVIHVHSLDRLARNLQDLMKILDELTKRGCEVHFHKEALTFSCSESNAMNRLILQIFGALAEWERSIIRERQKEGIAAAKKAGKPLGRPTNATIEQREAAKKLFEADNLMPVARVARETGLTYSMARRIRDCVCKSQ